MRGAKRVTVVGAGLAGLSASLVLAEAGVCVTLVSPQPSERAQSVMAEGGINAALDVMGEHDSVCEHAADTLKSAAGLASEAAVRGLAGAAPSIVGDLAALGVPFNAEGGHIAQRYFGGQKKARTAYAQASTGKMLVTALVDALRRYEASGVVTRLSHHDVVDLAITDGACAGVAVRDAFTGASHALATPVILATGGYGGLFGSATTGSAVNVGDATALAFARGIELANLEFVQYHPTTVAISGKRLLVSEAARGEGGRLLTLREGVPWYFMEERYPDLGNLMPRDVVSREEAAVLADPACQGVWLDMRHLERRVWRDRLPDLRSELIHYLNIDPARKLVPVAPGIHYCMGGIRVDGNHHTNIRGLYAAGECACAYHGANRLGGNSLLGAIYGGRVAAASALAELGSVALTSTDVRQIVVGACVSASTTDAILADNAADASMHAILAAAMGILRDDATLAAASSRLQDLAATGVSARQRRRLLLACAMVASARARKESRGAHFRSDFPATNDAYQALSVARCIDGHPVVSFSSVDEGVRS